MRVISVALLSLTSVAMLVAQTGAGSSGAQARPNPGDASPAANLSLEPVGPGDLLDVYVADYDSITRSYRVSPEGMIELPVVKQPIPVTGLRVREIEKSICKALADNKLMVEPMVAVSVLEYRSRPVNVTGAVREPLTLQAMGGIRLLDAISRAGGITPDASAEIIVTRPDLPGSPGFINHIPIKQLMSQSDPTFNIELQGGEEIRVPVADKLYITGNVKTPGAYSMDQAGGLTVLQALALCQGPLQFSKAVAVVYRPDPVSGTRQPINIPLREIMKRRSPDVPLLPNDILYVSDNPGKRVGVDVVRGVLGFGTAVGSGVLILGSK